MVACSVFPSGWIIGRCSFGVLILGVIRWECVNGSKKFVHPESAMILFCDLLLLLLLIGLLILVVKFAVALSIVVIIVFIITLSVILVNIVFVLLLLLVNSWSAGKKSGVIAASRL